MVKALFFDTGPIITLVMSSLSWILPKLKEQFGGKFYITPAVKVELIDRPMKIRRFQFEALQIQKMIKDGVLEVYQQIPQNKVTQMVHLVNSSFKIKNKTMDVVQSGEIEAVVSALETGADGIVMDERTLRLLIENPTELEKLLEFRFKKDVTANLDRLKKFSAQMKDITIIRSIELISVAYKMGILSDFVPGKRGGKDTLLNSVLWAAKYNGCAVTRKEIDELKSFLLKK